MAELKRTISLRIEPDLAEYAKEYARKHGLCFQGKPSMSAAIREMIKNYRMSIPNLNDIVTEQKKGPEGTGPKNCHRRLTSER